MMTQFPHTCFFFDEEKYRLATFKNYPHYALKFAILLANNGFVYIGSGTNDTVMCNFCGAVKQNWREEEKIDDVHRALSPLCPMVLGTDVLNIPMHSTPRGRESHEDSSTQCSGTSLPQPSATPRPILNNDNSILKEDFVVKGAAKCPHFAKNNERLATFDNWPTDHPTKKENLAMAGFYYDAPGTICFYCGGGLKDWESEEDPWLTHAYWFPKCGLVRIKFGPIFIDIIQQYRRKKRKPHEISIEMVAHKMGVDPVVFQIDYKGHALKYDAAVQALTTIGFLEEDVLEAAESLKHSGLKLSADILYTALIKNQAQQLPQNIDVSSFTSLAMSKPLTDQHDIEHLKEENNVLCRLALCTVCLDKAREVVFLPCGHLVCCTLCAAEKCECPSCHHKILGTVRCFFK